MKLLCDIRKKLLRHVMCQNFLTIKISTVRRNYAELTGINNDEIIFTLSSFSSIDIIEKNPVNKRLERNKKPTFPYKMY